jgi:hypothetical protein
MRLLLSALLAAAASAAPAPARAQDPAQEEEPQEEEARPGPFLAASLGGGQQSDSAPGLTGGDLGLRGHLEIGYSDGRHLSGALALALGRTYYDNTMPPPPNVQPDDLHVTRVGFGAVFEGRLPLGRLVPIAGAGAYLDRMKAAARGNALGIRVDYFEATDVAVGVEARAGFDVRVHDAIELGLRGGWHWSRTDLAELTGGAEWLSGPWLELRATFDASGFRMAGSSSRRR